MKKLIIALSVFSGFFYTQIGIRESVAGEVFNFRALMDLNYNPEISVVSESSLPKKSSSDCLVSSVVLSGTDPVNFQARTIQLELYHPVESSFSKVHSKHKGNPKHLGSVIVIPPTGGVTPFDQWTSRRFCKSGLQTALVYGWDFFSEPGLAWENYDREALRAVAAPRHVLEYLLMLKPGPVGILGTSLGALTTSGILSIEPRVSTGIMIVGGGPLHEILVKTDLPVEMALKRDRMKEFHLKDDMEYEQELENNIHIDTVAYAKDAPPKKIWMFIGDHDKKVPTDTQLKLWDAWKRPKVTHLAFDHVGTIVWSFYLYHHQMRDFFLENLKF